MSKKVSFIIIFCFILISLISIRSLFSPHYFPMHDDTQPTRIFLMKEAVLDGQIPARWVTDLGYGYGYPIFNFYAPLPYYAGTIFQVIGFDSIDSAKLVFGISTIGAGVAMGFLLVSYTGLLPAIAGGVIYTFFPYHAVNLYVRGALSEQFGYMLLPLVLLFFLRVLVDKHKMKPALFLGGSFALLVLSHNLSALMAGIIIFPFLVFSLLFKRHIEIFKYIVIAGILAFCLSAFYTLPLVFESQFTNVVSQVGGGADFKDHFICAGQLWESPWGYGGSARGCVDGMSFKLGKANIVFTFASLIVLTVAFVKYKKKKNDLLQFGLWSIAFSTALTLPISKFIWDVIPFFDYLQYPWRFLTFIGLGIAILASVALSRIGTFNGKKFLILLVSFVVLVTLVNNAKLFRPQILYEKNNAYYTQRFSIRENISRISDEYMPKMFQKPVSGEDISLHFINFQSDTYTVEIQNESSNKYRAKIVSKSSQKILLNIAPFPSWRFFLDGKAAPYENTSKGILVFIPKGEHLVELRLISTPVQKIGNALFVISIILIGAVIITRRFYGTKTS